MKSVPYKLVGPLPRTPALSNAEFGMRSAELVAVLRFNFKPSIARLLIAGLVDSGPVTVGTWAVRAGVPRNHIWPAVKEAQRLGAVAVDIVPEGIKLLVQPEEFWKERELCSRSEWSRAWGATGEARPSVQARLYLVTERPGLALALAGQIRSAEPESGGNRNPVPVGVSAPESGGVDATGFRSLVPLNVERLTGSVSTLSTVNVERLTGSTGFRCLEGWTEPETEKEAMDACALLFGGEQEMRNWGGRWRNRWRANPAGLRKVLNMIREDQGAGRKVTKSWGAHASYCWDKYVEKTAAG